MPSRIDSLPTLGVGVSLSLSAKPDPAALASLPGGPAFIEYAGLADVAQVLPEVRRIREAGVPVLYHPSYINFCGSFANDPDWLATAAEHIRAVETPWFAQDCAYCFWAEGAGYSSQLGYFIPPILNEASLAVAIERIREVQAAIPAPVAIEPPPMGFVVGDMPLFRFFGRLAEAADCLLLLDMGHLVSWEMASGQRVMDHLGELPVERVVEAHIAGGKLQPGHPGPIYVDSHESPILPPVWDLFDAMLPVLPRLRAVCYECEGMDGDTVMATLAELRARVIRLSPHAELVRRAEGRS